MHATGVKTMYTAFLKHLYEISSSSCEDKRHFRTCNMNNETTRQQKVARQIQRDLSEIFQRNANSLSLGRMVTVTHVRMSPDLENARVLLSVFPSDQAAPVMAHVESKNAEIRFQLGQRIRHQLRVVPHLMFQLDDSLDYIDHIEQLLANSKECSDN